MPTVPDQVEAEELAEQAYNAADPEMVNAARKRSARKKKKDLEVVRLLLSHAEGRAYLWNIMEFGHVHGNPVVPGDPHATYFNLGMQNYGKMILMDVMQFPTEYVMMCNEARNRK